MAYQSGKNVLVAFKVETTFNTAPGTVTGATQLRFTASPGLSLKRALVQSREVRSDGLTSQSRLGSREANGSYSAEMAVGAHDDIYQALMRSTWATATAITQATASLASISFTDSSTMVATNTSAGSGFLQAGIRVGDVFRIVGTSNSANNNKNIRVKSVATHTLVAMGTPFTTQTTANASFTLNVAKKLKNGTTPTKRSFYIEECHQDIDQSEVFGGCKWTSMRIQGTPDGMANISFNVVGASESALATSASPFYTSPTLNTSIPLVFADATISYNGSDIAVCTAFDLTYQITAKTEPVVGSSTSPDVFDNDATLSGTLSFIRQDLTNVSTFLNETEVELHLLLVEPESEPKDFMAIYIPRVKLTAADTSLGGDGAMIETLPFVTGKKESTTGYDDTMLTISSSAP